MTRRAFEVMLVNPNQRGNAPLAAIFCALCRRKKNVPIGIATEQRDEFLCANCVEEAKEPESVSQVDLGN